MLFAFLHLCTASTPLRAQLRLDMLGFRPELTATAAGRITVVYDCSASTGGAVSVTLFRDDGVSVQADGLTPGSGPFGLDLPLPTGADGRRVTVQGVARQAPGNVLVAGNRVLSLLVDDTGPLSLQILSPAFPVETADAVLHVRGRVGKTGGPETGGRVEFRRSADGAVLGGGPIRSDGSFLAAVDLASVPAGRPVDVVAQSFDALGNGGATATGRITRFAAVEGGLSDLVLTPPDGTITAAPGLRVAGRVTGDQGPYQVTVLVDGRVESSLVGLAGGTDFAHMLNLPGEGSHAISLRLQKGLAILSTRELGTVTLDRSAPSMPERSERLRRLFLRLHGPVH